MTEREKFEKWLNTLDKQALVTMAAKQALAIEELQAATKAAVPQWIPVGERLPEFNNDIREYIVYETLNNKTQHDYWVIPNDGREPFWNYYGEYVTHWMPLPVAPDGDK